MMRAQRGQHESCDRRDGSTSRATAAVAAGGDGQSRGSTHAGRQAAQQWAARVAAGAAPQQHQGSAATLPAPLPACAHMMPMAATCRVGLGSQPAMKMQNSSSHQERRGGGGGTGRGKVRCAERGDVVVVVGGGVEGCSASTGE